MRRDIFFITLTLIMVLLFISNIFFGAVNIPFGGIVEALFGGGDDSSDLTSAIILSSRLPQAVTALLAGASLSVSGLMLQTLFSNPLASPSILGVSSGAGVGVAIVKLVFGGGLTAMGLYGHLATVTAALVGAGIVLSIIIAFSMRIKSNVMLLVVGIMVGYIADSTISLFNFYAQADGVVSFIIWGMGDFTGVTNDNLIYFVMFAILGLFVSLLMIKPLNALLLGERYSQNLGINMKRVRFLALVSTGVLTAIVTAFCGPISFIGLAVPHIARLIFRSSGHGVLLPASMIIGAIVALACNLLTVTVMDGYVIPLNVITPLLGAPVIIYVIVNKKKIAYFN